MFNDLSLALLLSFISLSVFAAVDYECIPPNSDYSNIQCTDDANLFVAYDEDYRPQALLNTQGRVIASLKDFDKVQAWLYSDGFIPVLKNDKVGYINVQGRLVVPTIYDNLIGPDDKYNEVWAKPVYQGRIVVAKDGNYGVIDTNNKIILAFDNSYITIDSFSNERAPVYSIENGKWGLIDINGKEVVAPQYDDIDGHLGGHYGFHEGLLGLKKGNKWGFITKTGKVAIPFVYDEIRPFSEQLAGVRKGGKWGFINGANKTVIPFEFADDQVPRMSVTSFGATYFTFNNGTAQIADNADATPICVDKLGKVVTCSEW